RGRTAVDLVDMFPGFGIDKWWSPSAAVEAASAIFVRSTQPLHHAVDRDVGRGRQPHVVGTSLNNRRGPLLDPRYLLKTSIFVGGLPRAIDVLEPHDLRQRLAETGRQLSRLYES